MQRKHLQTQKERKKKPLQYWKKFLKGRRSGKKKKINKISTGTHKRNSYECSYHTVQGPLEASIFFYTKLLKRISVVSVLLKIIYIIYMNFFIYASLHKVTFCEDNLSNHILYHMFRISQRHLIKILFSFPNIYWKSIFNISYYSYHLKSR